MTAMIFPRVTTGRWLLQNHEAGVPVVFQRVDKVGIFPKQNLDNPGRTVAALDPHNLGRRIGDKAAFLKTGVPGDDCKSVLEGKAPYGVVGRPIKCYRADMQ